MKKIIIDAITQTETVVDLTAEELAQKDIDYANSQAEATARAEAEAQAKADKEAKDNLKASAKAKLVAGEPLTEAEADTLVL